MKVDAGSAFKRVGKVRGINVKDGRSLMGGGYTWFLLSPREKGSHEIKVSETFPPTSQISHYRIVSRLGAGGMGEVYLAEDTSELARTVALKIIPAEVAKNKDRLQRFTQEARTVSNLNHPNILTVYEFGQTDSVSFISTEYIDGAT